MPFQKRGAHGGYQFRGVFFSDDFDILKKHGAVLGTLTLKKLQSKFEVLIRNYSRRQASGFSFEGILRTRRQVLQIRQFHVVGDSTKPQTGNNTPMKQAFFMSTPTHRE
jgi:predicted glycosyltransferase involved in capsule biosynthesis